MAALLSVLVVLALLGIVDSLYMTLMHYGFMAPNARVIPSFCRMEARSCQSVQDSPYARVFGIPNSLLGVFYYGWILLASANSLETGRFPLLIPTLVIAWGVVLFSVYLAHALLFRLRVPCPLCFIGHGINLAIAILLTLVVA